MRKYENTLSEIVWIAVLSEKEIVIQCTDSKKHCAKRLCCGSNWVYMIFDSFHYMTNTNTNANTNAKEYRTGLTNQINTNPFLNLHFSCENSLLEFWLKVHLALGVYTMNTISPLNDSVNMFIYQGRQINLMFSMQLWYCYDIKF